MKLFLFFILSLFLVQACAAQSQLPKEMPAQISISLNQSGGMSRSYKKIRIESGVLEFQELTGNRANPQKWSATVTIEDLAKLYQMFVENKFDTIKNDERKAIVYDAGSESISISINKTKSFGVIYGKNSPLSGKNLERYQAVSRAINDFVAQHQNKKTDDSSNEPRTMSDVEKYIQGTWRADGENDRHRWFLEWNFDNGKFKQTGYPPIFQEGKYKIINVADGKITVELFDQKGNFGSERRTIVIVTDPEEEKLMISGTNGFSRVARKN